jgi:hypothetical protein
VSAEKQRELEEGERARDIMIEIRNYMTKGLGVGESERERESEGERGG